MRDYLKLWEIREVLVYINCDPSLIDDLMVEVEAAAKTCLCAAHSSSECCCGAWDDYSNEEDRE